MKKPKKKYRVFMQVCIEAEEKENEVTGDWQMAGETWAVSEAKAIGNVCYRINGTRSPYLPVATSAHWEKVVNWRAEEVTT